MPKVYITQVPHKHNTGTNSFVPSVNIGPATEFGELIILFPPRAAFYDTKELTKQLRNSLKDYDCDSGDCLLPMGDPVIQAAASAVLAKEGNFTVLKWDKNLGRYCSSKITL